MSKLIAVKGADERAAGNRIEVMGAFRRREDITFGRVDAAGLVFYPRYFEMVSNTVEAWFAEALGRPFAHLHLVEGLGTPTVAISAEFLAPSRLGETLELALAVREIGAASFRVSVEACSGDEVRMRADVRLVFVRLDPLGAVRIPDDLRAAMAAFLES